MVSVGPGTVLLGLPAGTTTQEAALTCAGRGIRVRSKARSVRTIMAAGLLVGMGEPAPWQATRIQTSKLPGKSQRSLTVKGAKRPRESAQPARRGAYPQPPVGTWCPRDS